MAALFSFVDMDCGYGKSRFPGLKPAEPGSEYGTELMAVICPSYRNIGAEVNPGRRFGGWGSPDTAVVRREGIRVTEKFLKSIAALLEVSKEGERSIGGSIDQSVRYLRTFCILHQLLSVNAQHPKSASRSNSSAFTPLAYAHRYRLMGSN